MSPNSPRVRCWTDLQEGLVTAWQFSVSDADMDSFAALSHDVNPLHCNVGFARNRGFPNRVVYGALLTAQLSRLVGMEIPGRNGILIGFTVSFRNPVFVNETVDLRAEIVQKSDAMKALTMKYAMRVAGRVVAKGAVEAVYRDDN